MSQSSSAGERDVVLRLAGITKRFGPLVANDDVSLELRGGQVMALLGENGAGKTTLMNILFGHYVPDEGRVEVFGRALPHGSPKAAIAAGWPRTSDCVEHQPHGAMGFHFQNEALADATLARPIDPVTAAETVAQLLRDRARGVPVIR